MARTNIENVPDEAFRNQLFLQVKLVDQRVQVATGTKLKSQIYALIRGFENAHKISNSRRSKFILHGQQVELLLVILSPMAAFLGPKLDGIVAVGNGIEHLPYAALSSLSQQSLCRDCCRIQGNVFRTEANLADLCLAEQSLNVLMAAQVDLLVFDFRSRLLRRMVPFMVQEVFQIGKSDDRSLWLWHLAQDFAG